MSYSGQPFDTPEEALKHFGVKGMKWGVRKKDDKSSGGGSGSDDPKKAAINDSTKEYMALKDPKVTPEQAKANLVANEMKFHNKMNDDAGPVDEASPSFVARHKKALIFAGVATAAVGTLVVMNKLEDKKNHVEFDPFADKEVSLQQFLKGVDHSKVKTWGISGYIDKTSYLREEFELPAGHVFHRLSTSLEGDHRHGTYATSNMDDFNRYVAGFRNELYGKQINHITFKATSPVKVPNLTTTLDTLREVMSKDLGYDVPRIVAKNEYLKLSGGSWKEEGYSKSLFSALSEKGYSAIVDEMDAGVIGERPLVVFGKNVTKKVGSALTETEIELAENNLRELKNRKI